MKISRIASYTITILFVSLSILSFSALATPVAPIKPGQVINVQNACDLVGHNTMVRVWKEESEKVTETFAAMIEAGHCVTMPLPLQIPVVEVKFEAMKGKMALWRLKLAEDVYAAIVDEVNEI